MILATGYVIIQHMTVINQEIHFRFLLLLQFLFLTICSLHLIVPSPNSAEGVKRHGQVQIYFQIWKLVTVSQWQIIGVGT